MISDDEKVYNFNYWL